MYVMTLLFLPSFSSFFLFLLSLPSFSSFFLFFLPFFLSPSISSSNILLVNPSLSIESHSEGKERGRERKREEEKERKEEERKKISILTNFVSFPSQSFEKEVQQKCLHFLLFLSLALLLSFSRRRKKEKKGREESEKKIFLPP